MRTTRLWAGLLLAAVAMACSQAASVRLGRPVVQVCPDAPEARYFPVGSFPGSPSHFDGDLFARRWYSQHLAAMEEPSLSCGPSLDDETYRFVWLRTFSNPVAVRVFQRGSHYGLEAVILNGAGGYEPGVVSSRVTRELTRAQWRRLLSALDEAQFWQTTTTVDDIVGNDGAQWIVEARSGGQYHFVDRWSGGDGLETIRPVGELFLELAELDDLRPNY
jgi:hypothetical protein